MARPQRPKRRPHQIEPPAKPERAAKPPQPTTSGDSLTISEFCRLEKVSRRTFDALRARGGAPAIYFVGKQNRIRPEAHKAWRAKRERMAKAGECKAGE
jgi:hypothetical protein